MARRTKAPDAPELRGVFANSWAELVRGGRDQLEAIWWVARTQLVEQAKGRGRLGRVRVRAVAWPELGQRRTVSFLLDPDRRDGGLGGWLRGLNEHLPGLGAPLAGRLRLDLVAAWDERRFWREDWGVEIGTVRLPGDPDVRAALLAMHRTLVRVTGALVEVVGGQSEVLRGAAAVELASAAVIDSAAEGIVELVERGSDGAGGGDVGKVAGELLRGLRDALAAHYGVAGDEAAGVEQEPPQERSGGRFDAWEGILPSE